MNLLAIAGLWVGLALVVAGLWALWRRRAGEYDWSTPKVTGREPWQLLVDQPDETVAEPWYVTASAPSGGVR